jgi:hypothetical protein
MKAPILPKQTRNQLRGLQAQDVASVALSRVAFVHKVETGTDIGIDFICEFRDGEHPTGKLFNVQCKAVPKSARSVEKRPIRIVIRTTTARYWLEQATPTIVLVADPDTGALFWIDPIPVLAKRTDPWREQKTVFLSVPKATVFNCFGSTPPDLVNCVCNSSAQLGVSFKERIYSIEKMIARDHGGMGGWVNEVAKAFLTEKSALRDSLDALKALTEFHTRVIAAIEKRIKEYCDFINYRAQKTYGKVLRKQGIAEHHASLDTDMGAGVPTRIMKEARAAIGNSQNHPVPVHLANLLASLQKLETLHAHIEGLQTEILKEDAPFIDAMYAILGPQAR